MASALGTDPGTPVDSWIDTSSRIGVAFIGGTGRSGSTLLSRTLGGIDGFCSVGELCWIWGVGVKDNRPCGCGQPFYDCPFWQAVGAAAFGGWDQLDAESALDMRRNLQGTSSLPALWFGGMSHHGELLEYRHLMARLYAAIAEVSGAKVIVDNSKQIEAALVAAGIPSIDFRLLHLVRRSHGVAHSWAKHIRRQDLDGGVMRRRSPAMTAVRWMMDTTLFDQLATRGQPQTTIHYEDFVANPESTLVNLLDFLGQECRPQTLEHVQGREIALAPDHSVWGNPMRLEQGTVTVRPDDAWRREMRPRDRRVVSALTMPGLIRQGYVGAGEHRT